MEPFDTWILPFTFIPGVGMLVLSTANRFHFVNVLIREMTSGEHEFCEKSIQILLKRSRHFQRALVSFYLSICLFAISALIGSINANWLLQDGAQSAYITDITITLGVASLIYGAVRLVSESLLAFHMVSNHCSDAKTDQKKSDKI